MINTKQGKLITKKLIQVITNNMIYKNEISTDEFIKIQKEVFEELNASIFEDIHILACEKIDEIKRIKNIKLNRIHFYSPLDF